MRLVASCAAADFFKSETARFMPAINCLRMRKSVNPAPTSMPPTAIGRTIEYQTLQRSLPNTRRRFAPRGHWRQGRPEKINEERNQQSPRDYAAGKVQRSQSRPDDVTHAQISGTDAGEVNCVMPPVASIGAAVPRPRRKPVAIFGMSISTFLVYQNKLTCAQKVHQPAEAHVGKKNFRCLRLPCCPAL